MLRHAVVLSCVLSCACGGDGANPIAPDPSAGIKASPSSLALVGATRITFTGRAPDPEGGSLTYDWNFGDGTKASGRIVDHVFMSEGAFDVVLTVTDDRGRSATAGLPLQARGLSGHWTPATNGVTGGDATINQSGSSITGQYRSGCCTHTFAGEVHNPRDIVLVFHFSGCPDQKRRFVGTVSSDLNFIGLTGPNCNVPDTTEVFTRE